MLLAKNGIQITFGLDIFLQDIIKEHTHISSNKQEHTCGTCKPQLLLPLYDLQDNKILMCISLFIKYIVHASNKGKLAQHGRKFCGCCKGEEIPAYPCIIELKAAF